MGEIDHNESRMRHVAEPVLGLSPHLRIFQLQAEFEYGTGRAAYDIKKLRGKGMLRKIGKPRRYEPLREGLRATTAGHHYESLRTDMQHLFTALGVANRQFVLDAFGRIC